MPSCDVSVTCFVDVVELASFHVSMKVIWVRHSGVPPFRCIIVIITLTLTLTLTITITLTPRSPEWRTSGMAGRYR